MKKITGKALSLVLSIALVASSFSASFASAATKTMDGVVDGTDKDKIYLVNGGTDAEALSTPLKAFIEPTLQTKTRASVDDDVSVDAISHVSGDSLVSLKTDSDDSDNAKLKLKSKSVKGTEVISVLYKGTYTDDDGTEYTVKARKNFTVYVYDEGQPVLGNVTSIDTAGKGLDDFSTLAQTRNASQDVGLYVAKRTAGSACAAFAPIQLTTNKNGISTAVPEEVKDSAYYIEVTSGDDDAHLTTAAGAALANGDGPASLTKFNSSDADQLKIISGRNVNASHVFTKDASDTNVTLTLKKLKTSGSVSGDSSDKYTFKTKVDKKIDVKTAITNDTDIPADSAPTSFNVLKKDGKTRLQEIRDPLSTDGANNKALDVTDTELVFPDASHVSVGDDDDTVNVKKISGILASLSIASKAHVGSIDVDGGTVDVSGKVGNITTDDKLGTGEVTIESSASVGAIDTTDAKDGDNGAVTVEGGTTGTIDAAGLVTLEGSDSDDPVVTGAVTANDAVIYSDEAKVTVASLKAKGDSGNLDIEGDNVVIGAVNMDSRTATLQLGDDTSDDEAFTGTISSITNATKATIKTSNEDTKATINGSVDVDTIDLDSDTTVTFAGNLTAKTVEGDGTLAIGAGKLYVSDSVSSTTLKLTDANIAVGTVAFKADSDAIDEGDFTCYGFALSKSSGNTVDTFKIASLSYAGEQITGGPSQIVTGESATYTASAYPGGTSLPTGYTVEWDLDGGSSDVFTLTSSGYTATVKVNSLDSTFASENKTTLTATLYDADGYEDDDYAPATFDITAVAVPSFVSDTGATLTVAQGASYTFKITTSDGKEPAFTLGGAGFTLTKVGKSGNAYFYKITATGAVKTSVGVYVNGVKTSVATIGASTLKVDTTKVTVKTGASYTFKVSGTTVAPSFTSGDSSIAKVVSSSASAGSYFFKVSGVKAGSTGIYVNGVRAAVVTVA
jgi:hypothetical protein